MYGRCTYQMTALLLEMPIFCDRTGCEIQLVSYGSKHSVQFLFDKPFVHPYTLNLKTTGYIWTFIILNDCSTIRDIPSVVQGFKRDANGALWPQTRIGRSLSQNCVHILQVHIAIWCATIHDNKTHIPYDCILHTKQRHYYQRCIVL